MNIYKLGLILESPVALPLRRARLGYLGVPNYIPASTLRGAILTVLFNQGLLDEKAINNEAHNPRIISSPAYPVIDGKESRPAHPFIFECKKCKSTLVSSDIFQKIVHGKEFDLPTECDKGHRALKQLHPSPIISLNGGVKQVEVSGFRYISVSISRRRAAAVKGVLYSYEVLIDPQEFWATIVSNHELELDNLLLLVGRGVSRGLGKVRVRVKRVSTLTDDLIKEAERFDESVGKVLIFQSMSPLLGPNVSSNDWNTYPKEIDLESISKILGIRSCGKLILEKAYGRTITFDAGWDIARKSLRPRFEAKAPGSIVKARVNGVSGEFELAITALRYLGTIEYFDDFPITGVNMLAPVEV